MEDKIDLDAICTAEAKKFQSGSLKDSATMSLYLKNVMTEAIHQALVLASERATIDKVPINKSPVWFVHKLNKQSILDVINLVE